MTSLANEVAIHQSTLTRIVERLEDKGYLVRRRSDENRRSVVVELTEQGAQLFEQLDAQTTVLVSRVLDTLGPDDREAAVHGMEVLSAVLDPRTGGVQRLIDQCCCGDQLVAPSELSKKRTESP